MILRLLTVLDFLLYSGDLKCMLMEK